jgi:hypothetical protein
MPVNEANPAGEIVLYQTEGARTIERQVAN